MMTTGDPMLDKMMWLGDVAKDETLSDPLTGEQVMWGDLTLDAQVRMDAVMADEFAGTS